MNNNIKYYKFGSKDSKDNDIIIEYENIPDDNNDAINICKSFEKYFQPNTNINLFTVENGIVVNTITSKSTIDGLNNSLYTTYNYHTQLYPLPIERLVKRNYVLNLYRCIRTVLSFLTRTEHRSDIKSCLRGFYKFDDKLNVLYNIDFNQIDKYNRKYTSDIDIWKTIPFYIGQTLSLLDGVEIYSKIDLVKYHQYFENFIYRKEHNYIDKQNLNIYKNILIDKIKALNLKQDDVYLYNDDFKIDMVKEK